MRTFILFAYKPDSTATARSCVIAEYPSCGVQSVEITEQESIKVLCDIFYINSRLSSQEIGFDDPVLLMSEDGHTYRLLPVGDPVRLDLEREARLLCTDQLSKAETQKKAADELKRMTSIESEKQELARLLRKYGSSS